MRALLMRSVMQPQSFLQRWLRSRTLQLTPMAQRGNGLAMW
jgi:hypothetical protein